MKEDEDHGHDEDGDDDVEQGTDGGSKVGAGRNAPRVSSPVLANSIVLSYLRTPHLTYPILLGLSYLLQGAYNITLPHLPHLQLK